MLIAKACAVALSLKREVRLVRSLLFAQDLGELLTEVRNAGRTVSLSRWG